MLNVVVQASEVMVLSMGYEVTYYCFFQEQMKTLHQATAYEVLEYLQTQCHHVSSCCFQCKSHGVCHLENPDKMYKIVNV